MPTSQDADSVTQTFKHRLEKIAEAKQLLETLNAQKPRPKEAVLLERRIKCCELAGLLHGQVHSMNSAVLTQAVECMKEEGIPLPVLTVGQILERTAESRLRNGLKELAKFDIKAYVSFFFAKDMCVMNTDNVLEYDYITLIDKIIKGHAAQMQEASDDEAKTLKEQADWELQVGHVECRV